MLLTTLLLLPALSQVTEYTSRAAWNSAVGPQQCADFVGLANGATVTNQYAAIGMTFTQANDTVLVTGAFVTDGIGVNCNGDMEIVFSSPQTALGCDFPGALQFNVYSGVTLVHSSSNFAGSGSGFFAGITSSTSFNRVVITDWVDGAAYVDNVCIAGGGFTLSKAGTCPGTMTLSTAGAPGGSNVAIIYGNPGTKTKPSGVCAGTTVAIANPKKLVILNSNGSGNASISFPGAAYCGKTMQAVVVGAGPCTTSNTLVL